jgi:N-methylhydantoinase A
MGCVIADMRQDFVQTINSLTAGLDTGALRDVMQQSRG